MIWPDAVDVLVVIIVGLAATCLSLWGALRSERTQRRDAEGNALYLRWLAAFYRDAYDSTPHPRSRSHVSFAKEGYARFSLVDELTRGAP